MIYSIHEKLGEFQMKGGKIYAWDPTMETRILGLVDIQDL